MEISTGGRLHFADKAASVTAVYLSDISIPWSYTTELRAEQNCLHYQGILVMQTRISLGLEKQIDIDNDFLGALSSGSMGNLKLYCNHGLAFDQSYSSMHELIFIVSLL